MMPRSSKGTPSTPKKPASRFEGLNVRRDPIVEDEDSSSDTSPEKSISGNFKKELMANINTLTQNQTKTAQRSDDIGKKLVELEKVVLEMRGELRSQSVMMEALIRKVGATMPRMNVTPQDPTGSGVSREALQLIAGPSTHRR